MPIEHGDGSAFGSIVDATPTLIGPPVHAFRLVGKFLKHVRAAAQLHSDLLRFSEPVLMCRFLLACVGKPVAMTAREQSSGTVELGDPTTAVHAI